MDHEKRVVYFVYPKTEKIENSHITKETPNADAAFGVNSLRAFFSAPFYSLTAFLIFKLTVIQFLIKSALFQQFLMISLLDDMSILHNQDHICILNGRKAMGND